MLQIFERKIIIHIVILLLIEQIKKIIFKLLTLSFCRPNVFFNYLLAYLHMQ